MSSNGAHLEGFAVSTITSVRAPDNWRQLQRHEYSAAFGDMDEIQFSLITSDMGTVGYKGRSVLTWNGKVLDGWHQLRGAIVTNCLPSFEEFKGTAEEAIDEACRRNLARRHDNESQRSMTAARLADLRKKFMQTCIKKPSKGEIDKEAAATCNVSTRSMASATAVQNKGTEKLQEAVVSGTISVSDAAKIVNEPAKVQNAAVKDVQNGKASTVAAAASKPASAGTGNGHKKDESPPKDKDGKPYPQQAIAAVQFVSRLNELVRYLRDGCDLATQIAGEPIGLYLDPNGIVARLTDAKKLVLAAFPAHVCKNCKGKSKKCEWCRGNGWQTKGGFEQCPEPNA